MELTPFLLEQRGVGDFLYHRVLEREDRALRLLSTIHNPGSLERPQLGFQRLACTWKHAENAFIVEASSENRGDLGDALGRTETIKALHQLILIPRRPQRGQLPARHTALSSLRDRAG